MSLILDSVKSLVFPDLCIACRVKRPHADQELCKTCLQELPFIKNSNDARAALEGKDQFPEDVEKFMSLLYYTKESYVAEMIHYIKYDGLYKIGRYLGGLLYDRHMAEEELDGYVLVPVPIHRKKLKVRGYNQAEEIAKGIATKSNLPICSDYLIRKSDTLSQTKKTQSDRTKVLVDAFGINPKVTPPSDKIMLVDDVVTTGSTIAACTRYLMDSAPSSILVATLGVSI